MKVCHVLSSPFAIHSQNINRGMVTDPPPSRRSAPREGVREGIWFSVVPAVHLPFMLLVLPMSPNLFSYGAEANVLSILLPQSRILLPRLSTASVDGSCFATTVTDFLHRSLVGTHFLPPDLPEPRVCHFRDLPGQVPTPMCQRRMRKG